MIDWLAIWGVTSAVGFFFMPILEDLAKDAAKKWAVGFFRKPLNNVLTPLPTAAKLMQEAAGKALKGFLDLFQGKLQEVDLDDAEIKALIDPMRKFIKDDAVRDILGEPFRQPVWKKGNTPGETGGKRISATAVRAGSKKPRLWEYLRRATHPKVFPILPEMSGSGRNRIIIRKNL